MSESKPPKSTSFNTLYVIGSMLFLLAFQEVQHCFNTLYVIGSTLSVTDNQEIYKFQYIICDRFKKKYKDIYSLKACFNTLYVIGSKTKLWIREKRYIVSIHYM